MIETMKESSNDKVLIFDWDDTICPSSYVDHCKVESFRELSIEVSQLH